MIFEIDEEFFEIPSDNSIKAFPKKKPKNKYILVFDIDINENDFLLVGGEDAKRLDMFSDVDNLEIQTRSFRAKVKEVGEIFGGVKILTWEK